MKLFIESMNPVYDTKLKQGLTLLKWGLQLCTFLQGREQTHQWSGEKTEKKGQLMSTHG